MEFEVTGYFKELDWIRLQKVLFQHAQKNEIELQALVMMDTHFHVLIESKAKKENFFSVSVHEQLNGLRKINSDCEPIESVAQYLNAYKYLYNNPIQAGLCEKVEDYAYSSLRILLGYSQGHCLISDKLKLIQNPYHVLKWLNTDVQFKFSKMSAQSNYL